jgi:hypothetical protein
MYLQFSPFDDSVPPVDPWMETECFIGDLDDLERLFGREAWFAFLCQNARQSWNSK